MRFMVPVCAVIAGAALIFVTPAAADVTRIQVDQGKPFTHKPSGIVVADTASGLPRAGVAEFDDKQLDVIVDYRSPDEGEVTTVYLFRKVTGDVPVWFDRIQRTVQAATHFGTLTPAIPAA